MGESNPFYLVAVAVYLVAAILYALHFVSKRNWWSTGTGVLVAGFVAHTGGLIARSIQRGTLAVTTTDEALVFYGWVFVLAYLGLALASPRLRDATLYRRIALPISMLSLGTLALAASPLFSNPLGPLMPALRSHWLIIHVSLTIVGEGFFAIAFFSSVIYLFLSSPRRGRPERVEEQLAFLDLLSYRAIAVGFVLFTLGAIFFGAIWAQHAWGRYWGWDPKETFSLVTWLVYVLYLHQRLRRGWRHRSAAWIAVIGFLLALFTFAGVNYLIRGLHSYV